MSHTPQSARTQPETAPSTRIGRRLAELRRREELGLIAYFTAGDPSLEATGEIVLAAAEAGADVIELGVPFSDPIADGPVIQRASDRALRAGTSLEGIFDLVARLRRSSDVPLVLFSYFNPILQMGLEKFARRAAQAGADGVLATDLTPEEGVDYRRIIRAAGLDTIFLAAPTTPPERIEQIAAVSTGFLYLISRTGVTGQRDSLPGDLASLIARARSVTSLPLAVGFGLSQPEHLRALVGQVEAAVVGSALVAEIERAPSPGAAAQNVAARIAALKRGARER
ncbi:MAG TPA: tryptophan synthase subunit alpha [Candidatus Dormibacteraeota bacterium]|nr:tryptophan synthase subunit alpha [Candidatus Dormibacteraeota bacterium]